MSKKVLIGLSWPYANGDLHIGHLGSSLPADVLARFHRKIGNDVMFVSGSDCYGTPTSIQSQKTGIAKEDIVNECHKNFKEAFDMAGFSFTNYSQTTNPRHADFVQNFHRTLNKTNCVEDKTISQYFCDDCNRFLADRFVEGLCPFCKSPAKGDSCDVCGKILEPEILLSPKCAICGAVPTLKQTTQTYIKLSSVEKELKQHFENVKNSWTINAINMTSRYFDEGLHDRAITRNLDWGVPVPDSEDKTKVIYNWAENVLGYITASKIWCEDNGKDYLEFWKNKDALHYYVHAKDNIPYHTIIFPALLLANGEGWHLPDVICASEYVTIENKKVSKSKGTALSVKELLSKVDVDFARYYLLKNINDRKDVNFSFEDFVNTINGELINNWGNLVNRTFSFIKSKFDGTLEVSNCADNVKEQIEKTFAFAKQSILDGKTQVALKEIMLLVSFANKLFDDFAPWNTIKESKEECAKQLSTMLALIANIAAMLDVYLPTSCQKVFEMLNINNNGYEMISFENSITLGDVKPLFARLEKDVVYEQFKQYI